MKIERVLTGFDPLIDFLNLKSMQENHCSTGLDLSSGAGRTVDVRTRRSMQSSYFKIVSFYP